MPVMKNSRLSDDWVARAVANNPIQKRPDGSFLTCPVRLSFVHLVKPNPNAKNDDGTPKATPSYEVTALFPPGAQQQLDTIVRPDLYARLRQSFPQNFDAEGRPFGLHFPPWRDQGEKQQYAGYTPGLPFIRMTTQYRPQIVDPAMNPIVDENRVYAGVWAILAFNLFEFGKSPPRPKKGYSCGLQGVMLVADDEKLAGGAPDPKAQFEGVRVDAKFDAAAAFGAAPGAMSPPSSIMPLPTSVAAPSGAVRPVMPPPVDDLTSILS